MQSPGAEPPPHVGHPGRGPDQGVARHRDHASDPDPGLHDAIVRNDDNLSHGNIISVQTGPDDYITAHTGDDIGELRAMLASARVAAGEWCSFRDAPDIIAGVKDQPLR